MHVNSKIEEILNTAKLNELLHKKELEEKNKNTLNWDRIPTVILKSSWSREKWALDLIKIHCMHYEILKQ